MIVPSVKRIARALIRNRRTRTLEPLCESLAALLDAGLPLQLGIQHLLKNAEGKFEQTLLNAASLGIEKGEVLSVPWQGLVPPTLETMIRVGEHSGQLAHGLHTWCSHIAQEQAWQGTLVRILSYPCALAASSLALILFCAYALVPTFVSMYDQLGFSPPMSTLVIEHVLLGVPQMTMALATLCAACVGACAIVARTSPKVWAKVKRFIPGYKVRLSWRTHRLATLLSFYVNAGIPLVESLRLLSGQVAPRWLSDACRRVEERVMAGESLSQSFAGEWDSILVTTLTWTEQTGDLAQALTRITVYTEHLLRTKIARFSKIAEPLLISAMGGMVAATMYMVFVPMYDLMTMIGAK